MVEHSIVSRKSLSEDRIAICPQFGCESIKRVKPLKLGFFGFGKYPRCQKHRLPLVYVDERISEVVDAALACLFDKSGLPPKDLIAVIEKNFPNELSSFINSWVYCITIGRGAKIISIYMDTIANSYLKQITKKQLKALKDETSDLFKVIRIGMNEITLQYERLLKHLRIHSEVFVDTKEVLEVSNKMRNTIKTWLKSSFNEISDILKTEENQDRSLSQVKACYDKILNLDTCRCLLGLSPTETGFMGRNVSAFERFSKYFEFWQENLTQKFTKPDIENLYRINNNDIISPNSFLREKTKASQYRMENQKELIKDNTSSESENCYGIIYLLTDTNIDGTLQNKMYYIGVTIRTLRRRFLEHLRSTENNYLKKAINRYHKNFEVDTISESFSSTEGGEFTIKVIDTAKDLLELGEKEKNFIDISE